MVTQQLASVLELFLQEKVQLFSRGCGAIADLDVKIPPSWTQALSLESSIADSIARIWSPISNCINDSLNILTDHAIDISLAVSPTATSPPRLLYILKGTARDTFGWLASLPATEENIVRCEARLGVKLPQSYRLFSQVHNGFLLDGASTVGPRPLNGLFFISTLFQCESTPHDFSQLLAFSGDGAGNEQCYDLARSSDNSDYLTVDWDHETQETGAPQAFWRYFDKIVARRKGM
jgi:hypothetical protein